MKAHKYWSLGALLTMFGTFYTGYKGSKSEHKYFAVSLILSILVDTFISKISLTMQPGPKIDSISVA